MKVQFLALKLDPDIVHLNKIFLTFETERIDIRGQHESFIAIFLDKKN